MNTLLTNNAPLSDSEKIALLMDKMLLALNCLELGKKGELPPHIAKLAWQSLNDALERLKS